MTRKTPAIPKSLLLALLLAVVLIFLSGICTAEEPVCQNNDCQHNYKSWFEEASQDGLKFLQENVFGQKREEIKGKILKRKNSFQKLFQKPTKESSNKDKKNTTTTTSDTSNEKEKGILDSLKEIMDSEHPDQALLNFLLRESASHEDTEAAPSFQETARLFIDNVKEIREQLRRVLGSRLDDLMKEHFRLPAAWYLLRKEQETKHPYWKTKQHQYFEKVTDTDYFRELHKALYLSNLAYADTEQAVIDGLANVDDGAWQLLFCDTLGNPKEPAHYVAIQKQTAPMKNQKQEEEEGFWKKAARNLQLNLGDEDDDTLKVMIVVRGTKTISDILSDGLLEALPFKERFQAHGGIATSGKYVADKHIGRLKQLLEASGRSKLEVIFFGHSLGCGTAAIAAMEFHDNYQDIMTVQSVGFGCPSLVSPELSEQYKGIITTVITDADVVPRMSGSSAVNLHLRMMSLDWTDYMWEEMKEMGDNIIKDITERTNGLLTPLATDLLTKLGDFVQKYLQGLKPKIAECRDKIIPKAFPIRKVDNELVPPGTCLHLYRTATGFEAAYTPCTFFDEIEYVPHLVEDHMCGTGYHFALLNLLRQQLHDHDAKFENVLYP